MTEGITEQLHIAMGRSVAPGEVLLGRYRIVEWIGSGSFGVVMRAFDVRQGCLVAIKIRHRELELSHKDDQRFLREIRAVASLRNEHTTRLFDYGRLSDGTPYMVVEHVDGLDLRKLLSKQGRLEPALAVDCVLQACHALAEAHALGIIHRDVKPGNVMLATRRDGSQLVKVVDFGCAKAPGTELTQSGSMVGTPAYMSPEQMSAPRAVDARSDIWSVGAMLYHLVEGHPPFPAKHLIELATQVATEPTPAMSMAPELAPVIARCLQKHPRDRYASIVQLAEALAPFSSRASLMPISVAAKRPRLSRRVVVLGGALASAGVLTVAIAMTPRDIRVPPAQAGAVAPAPSSAPTEASPPTPPPPPAAAPQAAPVAPSPPPDPAPATEPAPATAPVPALAPPRRVPPTRKNRSPVREQPASARDGSQAPCDPTATPGGC